MRFAFLKVVLLCLIMGTSLSGLGQTAEPYPSRPIEFVVGYAAGGPTDITARLIALELRGSKPEPPKIPSADQRGLSRARSMG